MAKKGKKKDSSSSASLPKCVCEHPYVCSCGNRPARPSKGHKWDAETQQWGGKGHKQKGASGQTASKSKEAQTTAVGQTTVAQWQKMPTTLLETACKREGRPYPKYKSIGRHRFRVIVQDAKASRRGTDHDLILVPANTVDNEEQAKQEAALLALLHLTPTIPHERKLPEPYKTTWLNALKAAKEKQQQKKTTTPNNSYSNNKPTSKSNNNNNNNNNNNATTTAAGAKSSSNLSMANSFVSRADKRRQNEERRRERATRIRKHEAIRMANKDHQVFLSARTRQQIETLLRGETVVWENDDNNESRDKEEDEETNDAKAYVVGRLCSEGFTRAQARTAFGQLRARPTGEGEDVWDHVYDECLQWLCIHLDEHQLPEGFDPRGRTLDVVLAPTKKDPTTTTTTTTMSPEASALVATYGLTKAEALLVLGNNSEKSLPMEERVWRAFLGASGVQLPTTEDKASVDGASNKELVSEELEAMEAIFPPNEYKLDKSGTKKGFMTISIKLPTDEEEDEDEALWLEIVVQDGLYPAVHPSRVLVRGHWSKSKQRQGTSLHVALLRFLASLPPSEPMMYELFGQAQTLLQEASDGQLNAVSLTTTTTTSAAKTTTTTTASPPANTGSKSSAKPTKFLRRPRVRSPFWSLHPTKTPRAEPHPTVAASMKAARDSLPAAKMKEEFLSVMRKAEKGGRVVLVTGATGSGKTTQIPQFILEDAPGAAKIVVAQPRRLAATGVAGRVANERGESKPGTASVGYVVRGDTALCKSTRLVFCTTGVLLRQLQSEGPLDCMTHIIVDEVHERHLDTDVLLGVLKAKLETTPHLKVILMSATLDADRFSAYWGPSTPRVHIPGRTFPVTDYMLEDVLAFTGYVPPKKGKKKRFGGFTKPRKSTPWADSEKSDEEEDDMESIATETTVSTTTSNTNEVQRDWEELAKRVDESNVDYDMLGQLVKKLVQTKNDDGSILVFLSGAPEINNAINTIQRITRGMSVMLLPLHGSLQPKDQNAIFRTAPRGSTKVVVSTNVAETSITIPDCTVVIDCCREKQSSYDPVNRMPLLLERFAAKASLKQRRGRAGRVRKGVCYKLISKGTYAKLPDHGTPEIHRCALDQTLLSLLFLGVEQGSGNFLRTLLDPPSQQALDSAILSLQKLGAVSPRSSEGKIALTPLGMHLAGIPAPPTVGKSTFISFCLFSLLPSPNLFESQFSSWDRFSVVGVRPLPWRRV